LILFTDFGFFLFFTFSAKSTLSFTFLFHFLLSFEEFGTTSFTFGGKAFGLLDLLTFFGSRRTSTSLGGRTRLLGSRTSTGLGGRASLGLGLGTGNRTRSRSCRTTRGEIG
jgi:hypothetical protein